MIVIKDKRNTGKTTKLANLVENDCTACLLVLPGNLRECHKKFPYIKNKIFSMTSQVWRGTTYTRFYVDDIDQAPIGCLASIPASYFGGCSFTENFVN